MQASITLGVCCVIVSSLCASVPRERVLWAIDRLEESVNERDLGAYMSLVDPADQVFVTEQRAWFADLQRNPVEMFSIEPVGSIASSSDPRLVSITKNIRINWALKADGIERSIEFAAQFEPVSDHTDGPWRYAGRDWGTALSTDSGLRVFADDKQHGLALRVLDIVPNIQSAIEHDIAQQLSVPLTIKSYEHMADLQFSISMGYLDPIAGWNEPGESIKILGREDVSTARLSSLLAHEIGHAVSFEYGQQIINAPWWTLEGIAELVSMPYQERTFEERQLSAAKRLAKGDRRTWDQLSDFKGEALNHASYVYWQGWSMVQYISDRFGVDARNEWFIQMGQGKTVQQATQIVLGLSMETLDREWELAIVSLLDSQTQSP
ncbi:MAG: hypothetical protein AB8C13_05725 [Phycisphaerales bacterium]